MLEELKKLSKQRYVPAHAVATVYAGLGDKEQALIWLERAFEDKSKSFVELKATHASIRYALTPASWP